LRSSDRYAWTWAEDIDWWTGKNLPAGFTEALFRAKKKVASGQPLGYDIDQMIKKAQEKAEEFYKDKK
jgi:RNase adaptor protein for sRNA GlmZ degradation